jgi:hypothetical protein
MKVRRKERQRLQRQAERVRLCRRRRRHGRAVLRVELDVGAIGDVLVEAGYLEQWDAQNRDAIRTALEVALDAWSRA